MTGEGEGETKRQSCTFHSHVVQEVRDTVHNVVKELQRDMGLVVCILERYGLCLHARNQVFWPVGRKLAVYVCSLVTPQYLFPCYQSIPSPICTQSCRFVFDWINAFSRYLSL